MKKDDRTDEQLYTAARIRDQATGAPTPAAQAAGAQLYARYFTAMRGFFINKVAEPGAWDDLAQKTFEKVLYDLDNMTGSSFRAYLYGVAFNILRAEWRTTRTRNKRRGDLEIEDMAVADIGPGLSTLVANKAEAQRLIQALRQIPIKYQAVFEMYYWQDMTAAQIAEVKRISLNTVRGQIRLAKKALSTKLELQHGSFGELVRAFRNVADWAREVRDQLTDPVRDDDDDE